MPIKMADYISLLAQSPLAPWGDSPPWQLTNDSQGRVRMLLAALPADYKIEDEIAVHWTATVEPGAVLKGPLIIGPHCYVAAGAYLRGGNWLGAHCIIGPACELKSSFVFEGSKLAHFNFVGDSILGAGVNMEAGSIICNYRNERADKQIKLCIDGQLQGIGIDKFGALLGDNCRIGANAVLAPGAVLLPKTVIARLGLYDGEI